MSATGEPEPEESRQDDLSLVELRRRYEAGTRDFRRSSLSLYMEVGHHSFDRAHLRGANFEGIVLSDSAVELIDLTQSNLRRADLRRTVLMRCSLKGADLSGSDLSQAIFVDSYLGDANLRAAEMNGTEFIVHCNLERANLEAAVLTGAKFSGANLAGANLAGANLSRTDLREASLEGSDLTNVDLTGADLTATDLMDAVLAGADLTGADLTAAKVTRGQLAAAKSTKRATLPSGLTAAELLARFLAATLATSLVVGVVALIIHVLQGEDLAGCTTLPAVIVVTETGLQAIVSVIVRRGRLSYEELAKFFWSAAFGYPVTGVFLYMNPFIYDRSVQDVASLLRVSVGWAVAYIILCYVNIWLPEARRDYTD